MKKVVVLVPFALDKTGVANRRAQLDSVTLGSDIQFDYKAVKAGPALYDSYHDWTLADVSIYEAGMNAEEEGYDAVCIDTMSDSGMNALRSVLDIPVIGPGRSSYLMALMLGGEVFCSNAVGPLDESVQKRIAGIRACRQVCIDSLNQYAPGC